jgi:MoaA/NifB/PqqE/SkfB family radical SAM enzyme
MIEPSDQFHVDTLASGLMDADLLRVEEAFNRLGLDEKLDRVMSFSPGIYQVETTTRCNLDCPLCSTHHLSRGRRDMPLEVIRGMAEANPQMRYMCLHLMGEPLLSETLFPIVRHLKSRGIYTYFSSNGMLLEKHVPEILSSGLDKISISLDGVTQEDLVRYRRNADLETIVRGIKRLRDEREGLGVDHPLIQIQTIMFSYNEAKEASVIRFLTSLNADRIKLKKPSFDTFGGRNEKEKDPKSGLGEPSGKYSRNDGAYARYRERAVCRLLFQGFVLSDGSVVPCCIDYDGRYAFGNLNRNSWAEIWFSKERRQMLTRYLQGKLGLCRECSLGYEYATTVMDRRA